MSKNIKIPYGPKQKTWNEQVPDYANVTGPQENPIPVYPKVPSSSLSEQFPELDYKKFELSPQGLTKREVMDAMSELEQVIKTQHINFTGFQVDEDLDYTQLAWLLDIHTNNVGDPYSSGYFTLNTKLIERSVLDYFASLWNAEWPHKYDHTKRYWGYILSMGATEGNLYAIYNGRNYLNGGMLMEDDQGAHGYKDLLKRNKKAPVRRTTFAQALQEDEKPNKYTPVSFYSEDTHYSIVKAMNVMQVKTFHQLGEELYPGQCPITKDGSWPTEVPSHNILEHDTTSGTIKVDELKKLVRFFLKEGYPPLIVLNVGTTWKGAYDNVPAVNDMLKELGEEFPELWEREVAYRDGNGKEFTDHRRGFWVHVDGALGAAYLPFVEMAYNQEKIKEKGPIFDFRNEAVMSICCSMHKWIGGPWPGGVYMTKNEFQLNPPSAAGYIDSPDTTLGGSRNAFSPVILWLYFARMSYEDNIRKVLYTNDTSKYLRKKLKELEAHIQKTDPSADLWIHRSELSLAVTFRAVNPTIAYKFTVDCERLKVPVGNNMAEERTYAHIYSMKSLGTFEIIDAFINHVLEICDRDGWKTAFPTDAEITIDGKPNPGQRTEI